MWFVVASALAQSPPPLAGPRGPDASPLPWQVQNEQRWAHVDLRAARTQRLALAVSGAAVVTAGVGALTLGAASFGDDVAPAGYALAISGGIASSATMPVFLGSVGRSHRSLRERGVDLGAGYSTGAWITYAFVVPAAFASAYVPGVFPIWSGMVLGLGCAQAAFDERGRRAAGLPSLGVPWRIHVLPKPDGVSVTGVF